MTRFIDVPSMNRLVADIGLPRFIDDLSVAIGKDFARWHDFDKTARLATHSPLGVIELMPVADARHYAFKYVNGHPDNALVGLSTVMAFGVLSDVATGYPVLMALSNKDFVGETLGVELDERLDGTLAATALAAEHGAAIFRAHEVAATRRVVEMVAAITGRRGPVRAVRGLE